MRQLTLAIILAIMGFTLVSAQSTDMLIVEGNTLTEQGTTTLNPFYCTHADCGRIVDLLFPNLLNVDGDTGWLIPDDDNTGLVQSWEIDDNVVTYTLRNDKFWSDGTPITAYDVYFSYQVAQLGNVPGIILSQHIQAGAPLDEHSIQFLFEDVDCNDLPQSNFPIIPAHVYDTDFAESMDYADSDNLLQWHDAVPLLDESMILDSPEYKNPTVTGGTFHLIERRFDESIHLVANDGSIAFNYADVTNQQTAVDRYLRGDFNLIVEPPYHRRDDLRADDTSTVYTFAGNESFFIGLNLADPDDPQSAVDGDGDGNPIEQGVHPILGDAVVRQAMQMALDVPAMIDAVIEGDGVQIASSLPPTALGFNPQLEPMSRDVMSARQMLSDAGWRDMDGDGWRECLDCLHAEHGQQLSIRLDYYETSTTLPPVDNFALVTLIQNQLRDIGIEIIPRAGSSLNAVFDQNFDAVLLDAVAVDLQLATKWDFFRQSNDIVGEGLNFTSYANDEVNRLLDEADHVPDCNAETRRTVYQEVESILQADQPYLWLFSPNRMVVSRQTYDLSPSAWEQFLP